MKKEQIFKEMVKLLFTNQLLKYSAEEIDECTFQIGFNPEKDIWQKAINILEGKPDDFPMKQEMMEYFLVLRDGDVDVKVSQQVQNLV